MNDLFWNLVPVIVLLAVTSLLWFVFRNKATRLESIAEFDSKLAAGRPVLIKFFKNT